MPNFTLERSMSRSIRRLLAMAAVVLVPALVMPSSAAAQFQQRDEQFYYPGDFNWQFLKRYPEAARLFNAFDYGHAVLYEKLYATEGEATDRALEKEYQYLTTDLLIRPPRFAIVEEAVMPRYAKLAWRAKQMFDWAHILHRQIYDIYADPSLTRAQQDSLIEQATDYYLSREEYAFVAAPKSMALMDEQYYSQAFRKAYPKFNGLIWAYHWLQVGLYEPFIEARTPDEAKAGVGATLARFWSMLENPPERLPAVMPMTSGIAPKFSAAHPRAAVIFDNLHMMHDIISDILQNDTVPAAKKREVIYAALDEFQDSTRNVISMEMWRNMADHMGGVAAMGGPASGILRPIEAAATPTPHAAPAGGHEEHQAPADAAADAARQAAQRDGHADHQVAASRDTAAGAEPAGHDHAGDGHMARMMELHTRMMQDSVIRRRAMSDPEMRRLMQGMMEELTPAKRREMRRMMHPDRAPAPEAAPGHRHDAPARRPVPPAKRPAPADSAAHEAHHPPTAPRR